MKLSEDKALYRIASYCSRAERCEYDVRKKLVNWELTDEEQSRIIKRLYSEKFLDHSRFCKSFINDKLKYNKWGVKKIVYELRKKQIEEKFYTPILKELPQDEFKDQLIHILKIKIKSTKAKDKYELKNKLIRFALGRGFSTDLAIKCVDKILDAENRDYY